jgi:hypothetical protein
MNKNTMTRIIVVTENKDKSEREQRLAEEQNMREVVEA